MTSGKDERHDVVLTDSGSSKITTIKVIREVTGLGLADAKNLADTVPSVIGTGLVADDAQVMADALVAAGAAAETHPSESGPGRSRSTPGGESASPKSRLAGVLVGILTGGLAGYVVGIIIDGSPWTYAGIGAAIGIVVSSVSAGPTVSGPA